MNKSIIGVIIAVIIIVGAVFFLKKDASAPSTEDTNLTQATPTPTPTLTPTPTATPTDGTTPTPTSTTTPAPKTVEVKYTSAGFSPSTITIKKGDTIKFINNSDSSFRPASNPHPTHTDYPEFDAKQLIAAGGSWSFTFTKVGTWGYHNHVNHDQTATVIVTE